MDIQQYQLDRENDFQTFKSQYDELNAQYVNSLTQAVYDSSKVQEVLDLNKSLANLVNQFISESQTKIDTEIIKKLTDDIITYQKEYEEIKNSQGRSKTLISILNKENLKLQSIRDEFTDYLWILFGCIFFLILLIFTVPSTELPTLQVSEPSTM